MISSAAHSDGTKPVRSKKCDGCGKRRETQEWRIRNLPAGQTRQVAFCPECAIPLRRADEQLDGHGIHPIPPEKLKQTPALRAQAKPATRRVAARTASPQFKSPSDQ